MLSSLSSLSRSHSLSSSLSFSFALSPNQKERKFFYFVAVVILRRRGFLNNHNLATEEAKLRTCQACPGVITKPSAESIRVKFDDSAFVQRGGAAPLTVGLPNVQKENTEEEQEKDDGWLDDTSGVVEEEKERGFGGGYGTMAAETSGVRIDSSFDDEASCDSNEIIMEDSSGLYDDTISDDVVDLSQLAVDTFAAAVAPLMTPPRAPPPPPAPPSAIAVAGGVEGMGVGVREEGMLEAPSRADAKSWPSALKEHLVSKYGQIAADKMLECKVEERQKRFGARMVLSYDDQTPVLEMAWSGDCASKQKAQHVAAYLALMHIEKCDGAGDRAPLCVDAAVRSPPPTAPAAVSSPISPAAFASLVLLPSSDNLAIGLPTAARSGEEGLLEAPLRADSKSWLSALREHIVSTYGKTPAETGDMFEPEMQVHETSSEQESCSKMLDSRLFAKWHGLDIVCRRRRRNTSLPILRCNIFKIPHFCQQHQRYTS